MARFKNNRGRSYQNKQATTKRMASSQGSNENDDNEHDKEERQSSDNLEENNAGDGRNNDNDNEDTDDDEEDDGAAQSKEKNCSTAIWDAEGVVHVRRLQEEIRALQHSNIKMKRIIKKKKYDETEGEYYVRKLVAMQKTTLIKYVKHQIFPHVKSACNELLFNKPEIIEKCYYHLGIKCTADQQALRDDVCAIIKYSLCQKRKYVKERLRMAFIGKILNLHV